MSAKELAIQIVKILVEAGHTTYFAGGWVRDLLLKHPSDDIDIATSAKPEEVKALFDKTVAVGEAFGVVVVVVDGHSFEVASFRKDLDYKDGRRPEAIEYSSPEEDAKRRDFTINGMFYDPLKDKIYDFVGGQEDLKAGYIRAIGNPEERFREDRLRMIRAVRFSVRFGFLIDEKTDQAIRPFAAELFPAVSIERIVQELIKMAGRPGFDRALMELQRYGLLGEIFPRLKDLPLVALDERVAHILKMPEEFPWVLKLLPIFSRISQADLENLTKYLKLSRRDASLMTNVYKARLLLDSEDMQPWVWSNFYAQNYLEETLLYHAAFREDSEAFLKEHHDRKSRLAFHVEARRKKKPVLDAEALMKEGIVPGAGLGSLLIEAEKLSVNADLRKREAVLEALKATPLWHEVTGNGS